VRHEREYDQPTQVNATGGQCLEDRWASAAQAGDPDPLLGRFFRKAEFPEAIGEHRIVRRRPVQLPLIELRDVRNQLGVVACFSFAAAADSSRRRDSSDRCLSE
jgi:hypothetical protein